MPYRFCGIGPTAILENSNADKGDFLRGANHKALAFFGLEWMTRNDWRGALKCVGLPVITSPTGEEIEENNHLISSLFPRAECSAYRRLVCSFDRTYLQTSSTFALTNRGHVLLGGPHRPPDFLDEDSSQKVMKDPDGNVFEHKIAKVTCHLNLTNPKPLGFAGTPDLRRTETIPNGDILNFDQQTRECNQPES